MSGAASRPRVMSNLPLFRIIFAPGGRVSTPALIASKACSSGTFPETLKDMGFYEYHGMHSSIAGLRHSHQTVLDGELLSEHEDRGALKHTYSYFAYDNIFSGPPERGGLNHGEEASLCGP